MPYYTDIYGNASSKFYKKGRDAEQALYKLRESVAKSLNAKNVNEIYFTGSGCEADNWAIKGIALANKSKGNHIITSKIEHHAILSTCEYLEKHGFEVTEGIENRILSSANMSYSFETLVENVKNKRYTTSKIRRMIISALIGFTKDIYSPMPQYIRILGMNKVGMTI